MKKIVFSILLLSLLTVFTGCSGKKTAGNGTDLAMETQKVVVQKVFKTSSNNPSSTPQKMVIKHFTSRREIKKGNNQISQQ